MPLEPGTTLGPYAVTAKIGEGGMGEVYRQEREGASAVPLQAMTCIERASEIPSAIFHGSSRTMACKAFILAFFAVTFPGVGVADVARGAEAVYHHVHLAAPDPEVAGCSQWYIEHMGCEVMRDRTDRCQFGTMYLAFRPEPPTGGSDGSAVNHIGFSFTDLVARMKEFEAAGIKIVTPIRDVPGLFNRPGAPVGLAFVEDPWGTRIEVVEDPDLLGFHHVHLRRGTADPAAARRRCSGITPSWVANWRC